MRCSAASGRESCWRCRSAWASRIPSRTSSTGVPRAIPASTSLSLQHCRCASPRRAPTWKGASLGPIVERVFGNYVELEYAHAMQRGDVPPNIRIIEFFLEPGAWLNSEHAQQHYLSSNYTHVMRDVMARGVNVIAHLVAKRVVEGRTELSFGSNADITGGSAAARRRGTRAGQGLRAHRPGARADALHDRARNDRARAVRLARRA